MGQVGFIAIANWQNEQLKRHMTLGHQILSLNNGCSLVPFSINIDESLSYKIRFINVYQPSGVCFIIIVKDIFPMKYADMCLKNADVNNFMLFCQLKICRERTRV